MPVVSMGAAEQAQALELSGGRTAVQSSASPEGSHDMQLLLSVVAGDGPPALAGMGTRIMVLLEPGWSRFPERVQRLTCQRCPGIHKLSLPIAIYSEQHKMQPHPLISSLVPN